MTRLELLERLNTLNLDAVRMNQPYRYWACTMMYNTVIWRDKGVNHGAEMVEVIEGVPA